MHNKKYTKAVILLLFSIVITGLLITSCEITDPTEGLEVRLDAISRETIVNAYVYDANTLQAISDVKVTFTGDNASKIVDETNDPITQFDADNGIFIFGVEDGTTFSSSSPFKVNVKLEANGYTTETSTVKFTSQGTHSINFYLVDPNNLPGDSETDSFDAYADANGSLTSNLEYTTPKGTVLEISSGTTLQDENGNPLTGELNVNITVIPITSENTYNAREIYTQNDETISPMIKFNLSITDQNGREVDEFSENIAFSIILADELKSEYTAGETIPVWKQNSSEGYWEQVGEVTVTANGTVEGSVDEAGVLILGSIVQKCSSTITITNLPDNFSSSIQFFDSKGSLIASTTSSSLSLEINSSGVVAKSVRLNAELSDPFNTGYEVASNVSLQCGNNSVTIEFPAELMSLSFDITGVCTTRDPVVVINPNMSFSYKKQSSSTWQSGNLKNGKAVVSGLEIGETYEIHASFRDNTGISRFKIISESSIDILEESSSDNIIGSEVKTTTDPPTIKYQIDIGDECD